MRRVSTLALVLGSLLVGCTPGDCTDVGGYNGFEVAYPQTFVGRVDSAAVSVCRDGACEEYFLAPLSTENELGQRVVDRGRVQLASLAKGKVDLRVVIRGTQGVLTEGALPLELKPFYPNGKGCDGAGWVFVSLNLDESGRLNASQPVDR